MTSIKQITLAVAAAIAVNAGMAMAATGPSSSTTMMGETGIHHGIRNGTAK